MVILKFMPQYKLTYTFNGTGSVLINADNPELAEEMFYEGDFNDEVEDGSDYEVDQVVEFNS